MDFIDLRSQQKVIRKKIDQNIKKVLDSGQYIMGQEVLELERMLAEYVGVEHCISVSSGTDALLVALMALNIGKDDEVITTPFTFFGTVEVIKLIGAKPIFVDIDPSNYNINTELIETAITPKTKAIMPVSMFGQCPDFDKINHIANQANLNVIEDGAQSFGATYRGKKSCGLSTIGCTSFFPSKPLGGYGDSGACFTNDNNLAKLMSQIRTHGQSARYKHSVLGLNARMDTIQAAILLAKFEIFPEEVAMRKLKGQRYSELIKKYKKNTQINITAPKIEAFNQSVFAQYTIRSNQRKKILKRLKGENIPTTIHYPFPIHKQSLFKKEGLNFKEAEKAAEEVFSIPMHPYLSESQQNRIISSLFT